MGNTLGAGKVPCCACHLQVSPVLPPSGPASGGGGGGAGGGGAMTGAAPIAGVALCTGRDGRGAHFTCLTCLKRQARCLTCLPPSSHSHVTASRVCLALPLVPYTYCYNVRALLTPGRAVGDRPRLGRPLLVRGVRLTLQKYA